MGYYALYSLGGLECEHRHEVDIRKLAIYYSRHGVVYQTDLDSVLGAVDFEAFLRWFKARAEKEYPPDQN